MDHPGLLILSARRVVNNNIPLTPHARRGSAASLISRNRFKIVKMDGCCSISVTQACSIGLVKNESSTQPELASSGSFEGRTIITRYSTSTEVTLALGPFAFKLTFTVV